MEVAQKKTGTTTVGLIYDGGVVLAAEKKATMGYLLDSKEARKVYPIDDRMAITTAGTVGDIQTIVRYMRAEVNIFKFQKNRKIGVRAATVLLANILQGSKYFPYLGQFIIGGVDENGPQVYSLDPAGGVVEGDKYYATGSGSPMAFGVLEDIYEEGMDEKRAIEVALKAVRAATRRDIASGGKGYTVVVINKDGLRELTEKEIETYLKE